MDYFGGQKLFLNYSKPEAISKGFPQITKLGIGFFPVAIKFPFPEGKGIKVIPISTFSKGFPGEPEKFPPGAPGLTLPKGGEYSRIESLFQAQGWGFKGPFVGQRFSQKFSTQIWEKGFYKRGGF